MMETIRFYEIFYILLLIVTTSFCREPSIRLCADEKCQTIISTAKTVINFHGSHPSHVSFRGNTQCRVMAKSSGENSDLWEIEVQGRRGFAPRTMIMEQKILVKAENLIEVKSGSDPSNATIVQKNEQYDLENEEKITANDAKNDIEDDKYEQEPKHSNESEQEDSNLRSSVDEPLAIKRDMYKTGDEKEEIKKTYDEKDKNIRLELVGLQEQSNEDKYEENIVDDEQHIQQQSNEEEQLKNDEKQATEFHLNERHKNNDDNFELHLDTNSNNDSSIENRVEDIIETISSATETSKPYQEETQQIDTDLVSDQFESNQFNEQSDTKSNINTFFTTIEPPDGTMETLSMNDAINKTVEILTSNHFPADDKSKSIKSAENRDEEREMSTNNKSISSQFVYNAESTDNPEVDQQSQQDTIFNNAEIESSTKNSIEQNQQNVHEIPSKTSEPNFSQKKEEHSETGDIFSQNYQPESVQTTSVESEETNLYNNILILMEETFVIVKNLFNQNLNENTSKDKINEDQNLNSIDDVGLCENLQEIDSCQKKDPTIMSTNIFDNISQISNALESDSLLNKFLTELISRTDLIVLLLLTASAILIFVFGHYCIVNYRRENFLIHKLNVLERKLMLSQKESFIAKDELIETNKKLNSIADKSFGSDDMIKQYELERKELQDHISSLEKELETATEAGLELNKMISDLLSNQSGSDSIINSVEELQQQLNEQEATTIYINNLLAEKSRENSELQILLSDSNQKFGTEIKELLIKNDKLKTDKETMEHTLSETIHSLESKLETNANIISAINNEHSALKKEYDELVSKCSLAVARAESLQESIQQLETYNESDDINIKSILEATEAKANIIAMKKQNETLKDKLDSEMENNNRLKEDITRLRIDFNQNEKDKLEAETRLEVLSSYFKEKESQLQKELSVKEALFMKQQGESTSTVERIRSLQDDIQKLRSQNDQLRAEVEAQAAAHKAQINAAEMRAHDSWLAAKQAERRLEEARAEASILRKNLTSLTFNKTLLENNSSHPNDGFISDLNAPSPIHMESPTSPVLPLNLPPPPLIPTPLFSNSAMTTLGPPPFIPPPPLLPLSNDMRPAPIGRLVSPQPPDHRFMQKRYDNEHSDDDGDDGYPNDYPTDLYETETDLEDYARLTPRAHADYYRESNYKNYSPEVPTKKKSSHRKGTAEPKDLAESKDRYGNEV